MRDTCYDQHRIPIIEPPGRIVFSRKVCLISLPAPTIPLILVPKICYYIDSISALRSCNDKSHTVYDD